jgi:hypothetical protein
VHGYNKFPLFMEYYYVFDMTGRREQSCSGPAIMFLHFWGCLSLTRFVFLAGLVLLATYTQPDSSRFRVIGSDAPSVCDKNDELLFY